MIGSDFLNVYYEQLKIKEFSFFQEFELLLLVIRKLGNIINEVGIYFSSVFSFALLYLSEIFLGSHLIAQTQSLGEGKKEQKI